MSKKSFIGIDISDYSIEMVRLTASSAVVFSRVLLPEGIVLNGVIINEEALSSSLTELLKKGDVDISDKNHNENIIITIPKQQVYVKTFKEKLATQKENTIQEISKQFADIVPINILDFTIAYRTQTEGTQSHVLTAGVSKEVLTGYKNTFAKLGITPKKITLEVEALLKSFHKKNESVFVIDIGDTGTHIHAFDATGIVQFSIVSPVGVAQASKAIQSKLAIKEKDADELIRSVGLDYSQGNDEILYIMFNIFSELISDLHNSQKLFTQQATKELSSMILVGGGSRIPKIDEYLSYELKQTVSFGDKRLLIDGIFSDANAYLYAGAYGAALLAKDDTECIDFSVAKKNENTKQKNKKDAKLKRIPLIVLGAIVVVSAIGSLFYLYL